MLFTVLLNSLLKRNVTADKRKKKEKNEEGGENKALITLTKSELKN